MQSNDQFEGRVSESPRFSISYNFPHEVQCLAVLFSRGRKAGMMGTLHTLLKFRLNETKGSPSIRLGYLFFLHFCNLAL